MSRQYRSLEYYTTEDGPNNTVDIQNLYRHRYNMIINSGPVENLEIRDNSTCYDKMNFVTKIKVEENSDSKYKLSYYKVDGTLSSNIVINYKKQLTDLSKVK